MNESNEEHWMKIVSGLRLPIIVAPMFLVSGPRLVTEACRQGLIGSFPAAYPRTSEDLRRWLQEIERGLENLPDGTAPYAVNLIVHATNPRLEADLDLICEHKVPIVIASMGNPERIVERVHAYGGIVLTDVARINHARRAIECGVDGLILLCGGAGGHTGWINPFAFVPAVRRFYDGPVILAGAISDGVALHAAKALGADLTYVGTRFIAVTESDASPQYREMVVASNADDIVLSSAVSGLPANWLKASLEGAGYTDFTAAKPVSFDFGENVKAWRDIWGAGHGVGAIKAVATVADVVAELEWEYRGAALSI